jgi:hypothetical protein
LQTPHGKVHSPEPHVALLRYRIRYSTAVRVKGSYLKRYGVSEIYLYSKLQLVPRLLGSR